MPPKTRRTPQKSDALNGRGGGGLAAHLAFRLSRIAQVAERVPISPLTQRPDEITARITATPLAPAAGWREP